MTAPFGCRGGEETRPIRVFSPGHRSATRGVGIAFRDLLSGDDAGARRDLLPPAVTGRELGPERVLLPFASPSLAFTLSPLHRVVFLVQDLIGTRRILLPRRQEDDGGRHGWGKRGRSWYLRKEEIEQGSPSRRDGVGAGKEAQLRATYSSFIRDVGLRLRLSLLVLVSHTS